MNSSPPVHAAVIAINEAIDQGVPEGTMAAMQNPNAMLLQMNTSSAQHYQDMLHSAKAEKVANSRKRVWELAVNTGIENEWQGWGVNSISILSIQKVNQKSNSNCFH